MRKLLVFVFAFVSFYSKSQVLCAGSSGTITPSNPQNLSNPSYSLNPGGFTPNANGQFVVSPNVTTTYTIYTTGTNTVPTVTTTTVVLTVTVAPQPISTPTVIQSTCTNSLNTFNLGLTFNPPTPAPTYTIFWSTNIPGIVSSTQTSLTAGTLPGPYTATIVANGGCGTIVTISITPQPAAALFSLTPLGSNIYTVNCAQPTINIIATNPAHTYTWSSTSTQPINSPSISVDGTNIGNWSVTGQNTVSGCTSTQTFTVIQNVSTPTSAITPTLINITCTQSTIPTVSISATPSVNITHYIYSPTGGTFAANSHTAIYAPSGGAPGSDTYTYVLVDNASGCTSTKFFTVTSSPGFPTFSVSSTAGQFTLGCSTKSLISITAYSVFTNPTSGAPVTYTALPPGSSLPPQGATLNPQPTFTVNVPGTWTVIVRETGSGCATRQSISITQNILGPSVSADVPYQILDCYHTATTLQAQSITPNTTFNWSFPGTSTTPPGNVVGATITVNSVSTAPTTSLINTYTLTVLDNNNLCKSFTVVPMLQNLYPPTTAITSNTLALTCKTPSITLTNGSSSNPAEPFVHPKPVIGLLWEGPTPQDPLPLSTTYVGEVAGVYTLTGQDLNNGCTSTGTINITNNVVYPILNNPIVPPPALLDCGSAATLNVNVNNLPSSAVTFTWDGPAINKWQGAPPGNITQTVYPTAPGIYTVTVNNVATGCVSTTTAVVTSGTIVANFSADHTTGYAPLTVNFYNNSVTSNTAAGTTSIISVWNFGNGAIAGSSLTTGTVPTLTPFPISASISPSTTYNLPGTYTVVMYASKGTCADTVQMIIKVEHGSEMTIPNIFTPNGDGINDFFFLKATNLTDISAVIYDRWGHIVFELTGDEKGNISWDGKNQYGKEAAEGTYFYIIKTKGKDGTDYDKKGTLTLVR